MSAELVILEMRYESTIHGKEVSTTSYEVREAEDYYDIALEEFDTLEEAIKYCVEAKVYFEIRTIEAWEQLNDIKK